MGGLKEIKTRVALSSQI